MAQQTLSNRYAPAVFAITGIAVVFGGCLAYRHVQKSINQPALHRSNAVHHRRQRPDANQNRSNQPLVVISDADADGPLGYVMIRYGLESEIVPVGMKHLPQVGELEEHLDVPVRALTPALEETIVMSGLAAVFRACIVARSNNLRARIVQLGYKSLLEAIEQREITGIRDHALQLADLLNRSVSPAFLDAIDAVFAIEVIRGDQIVLDNPTNSSGEVPVTEELDMEHDHSHQEPSDELKGLLYHIAEDQARRKAYEHRGINCEGCGEMPIRGTRWHCLNCPDFDLCSNCEAQTMHPKTHVFVKIKIPLPVMSQPTKQHPLWYPGDPRKLHPSLDPDLKRNLAAIDEFDEPMIDALYDQFTSLANMAYHKDPANIKAAIDRRAFNKAMTSERWSARFAPNALYDRMFAFYDTDNNGLIGFQEFISGLSYLRGPTRDKNLDRALKGYDLDDDGFVDRKDFLRMFRAKYSIQRLLTSDMIESHEIEQTYAAMDVLRSSQPISSIFSQEEIPQGTERPRAGKQADVFGDMQPFEDTKTILDDNDAWVPRQVRGAHPVPSPEALRRHLSRFEELLYDDSTPVNGAAGGQAVSVTDTANAKSEDAKRPRLPYESSSDLHRLDEPSNEDILWQIIEDGLNEMLDSIFKVKEENDHAISRTRDERVRFREEIEQFLHEKNAFEKDLEEKALVDPLMADALKSYGKNDEDAKSISTFEPLFRGEIVPTDPDTLARREKDISEQPLADLLNATGYSVLNEGGELSQPRYNSDEANLLLAASGDPILHDDMVPLTRERMPAEKESISPKGQKAFIKHLASCQAADNVIEARGGPGRLSYDELRAMVDSDSRKELRGLIMSWLEWASF
nr:recoverin family protein [Quercus suber]